MDSTDYEARRKIQNREAQRRYREKQKQQANTSSNGGRIGHNGGSISGSAAANSANLQSEAMQRAMDIDCFSELFQSSTLVGPGALRNGPNGLVSPMESGNSNFDDLSEDYPSHYARSEHDTLHHRASVTSSSSYSRACISSLSKRHNLILTKADRMVRDLGRLYEFGVEMQLIASDSELKNCLNNIENLFHNSINKSAEDCSE